MMWKLILILATCLLGNISSSDTENGNSKDFFDNEDLNTSPDIWTSDRSVHVFKETTPLPSSYSQIPFEDEVTEILELIPDEIVSDISLQGQQESSTQNEQVNYPQLTETEKRASTDDTGFTANISSMSESSIDIKERHENPDASKYLTTQSFLPYWTKDIVTSPLSFNATSNESLTTGIENIAHHSNPSFENDERPIDINGLEIIPTQPAGNESSLIYSGGNIENNTFEYSPGANTTPQLMEVSGENPLVKNSTKPTSFPYEEINTLSEVYAMNTTPYSLEKIESTSNVSSSNDTKLTTFDLPWDTELPPLEQLTNDTYKLVLIGKCNGHTMFTQTFKGLYSIMNTGLDAKNSTKLSECKQVYEFEFTSNIASLESFQDVLSEIKEKFSPMHANIVNYDSEIYEISHTSEEYSENFVIPKMLVYISTGVTIMLIVFMIFVALCVRNKCKKKSTSIDLSDVPHLTLSIDDYKLSPIPRPRVSIRRNNREFLYAYSNETYSRTDADAVFSEHPNPGKEFGAAMKIQKDNPLALEMQTFEATRGTNLQKSAHEYAIPNGWHSLNEKKRGAERSLKF